MFLKIEQTINLCVDWATSINFNIWAAGFYGTPYSLFPNSPTHSICFKPAYKKSRPKFKFSFLPMESIIPTPRDFVQFTVHTVQKSKKKKKKRFLNLFTYPCLKGL